MSTDAAVRTFAIAPPIEPMLAKLAEELPAAAPFLYEPKWDGFRAIVFRGGADVFIQSRDLQAARSLLSRAARRVARRGCRDGCVRRRRDRDRDAARPRLRRAAAAAASGGVARREAREGDAGGVRRLRPARGRRARPARRRRRASAARGSSGCSRTSTPPIHLTPMTRDRARRRPSGWRASRAPASTA